MERRACDNKANDTHIYVTMTVMAIVVITIKHANDDMYHAVQKCDMTL